MTTRPSDNESRDEVHKVFITFDSQKTGKKYFMQDSLPWKTSERLQRIWENLLTTMSSKKWLRELMLISMESYPRRNSITSSPRRLHDHDYCLWNHIFIRYYQKIRFYQESQNKNYFLRLKIKQLMVFKLKDKMIRENMLFW